jgi:ABC-type multidrug transport system permease subunit
MRQSAAASSISSSLELGALAPASTPGMAWRAALASWRAMTKERLYFMGVGGGIATWLAIPLFQIMTLALVYGRDSDLLPYIVVAQAANVFSMNTFYWVGEILDRERVKGTLVALFLAPCSRMSWLSGFVLAALLETGIVVAFALTFGALAYGVEFDPNLLTIAVTLPLFLMSLWGIGVIFSGLGLLIRRANPLSNLAWAFVSVIGGGFYPIDRLPEPLATIAWCFPFGHGLQALADATLYDASLSDIAPNLLPLVVFAVATPVLAVIAFGWLERIVRVRGELDLY